VIGKPGYRHSSLRLSDGAAAFPDARHRRSCFDKRLRKGQASPGSRPISPDLSRWLRTISLWKPIRAGHTDNRPLVCTAAGFYRPARPGTGSRPVCQPADGYGAVVGIGTPESSLAAFTLGAAYIARARSTRPAWNRALRSIPVCFFSQWKWRGCGMAPAGDMFEMESGSGAQSAVTMVPDGAQNCMNSTPATNAWEESRWRKREKLEKDRLNGLCLDLGGTLKFFNETGPAPGGAWQCQPEG